MRKRLTLTILAFCCVIAQGWGFKTKGDGTTYTFDSLCEQEGSGVTYEVQEGIRIYTMSVNDTIAAGDRFEVGSARIVILTDDVTFVIEGTADFYSEAGCLFADMGILSPANGILMKDVSASTTFSSCYFVGVGLKFVGCTGGTLNNCTFQEKSAFYDRLRKLPQLVMISVGLFFFWSCHMAFKILVPQPGIEPRS